MGDSAPTGPVDPKFQVEGVVPHRPFFFSVNHGKLSFVWCKNLDRSFFRFVTMHACDGQTDGQTEFSSLDRVCTACRAVTRSSATTKRAQRVVLVGDDISREKIC